MIKPLYCKLLFCDPSEYMKNWEPTIVSLVCAVSDKVIHIPHLLIHPRDAVYLSYFLKSQTQEFSPWISESVNNLFVPAKYHPIRFPGRYQNLSSQIIQLPMALDNQSQTLQYNNNP